MKLEILDLEIEQLNFRDRYGQWHETRGCSIMGRSQFYAYLEQADKIIQSTGLDSIVLLYEQNDSFRHCCDRALQLNGIDPESLDCNGQLLKALLFRHDDGPGMLLRVNMVQPDGKESEGESLNAKTEAMVLASMLDATNSLKEAMDALNHPDGKLMLAMMKARADAIAQASAKAKGKDVDFENWQKRLREKGPVKIDMSKIDLSKIKPVPLNEKP